MPLLVNFDIYNTNHDVTLKFSISFYNILMAFNSRVFCFLPLVMNFGILSSGIQNTVISLILLVNKLFYVLQVPLRAGLKNTWMVEDRQKSHLHSMTAIQRRRIFFFNTSLPEISKRNEFSEEVFLERIIGVNYFLRDFVLFSSWISKLLFNSSIYACNTTIFWVLDCLNKWNFILFRKVLELFILCLHIIFLISEEF